MKPPPMTMPQVPPAFYASSGFYRVRAYFRKHPPESPTRAILNPLGIRTVARVEANEDVIVTAISSNTLEVRPPPVEEREQHVAPFDRNLTKANRRLVVNNCRCADRQYEGLDVFSGMAIHE